MNANERRQIVRRARSDRDTFEQGPDGKYRKVPARKALREWIIGAGWSATPQGRVNGAKWCVSSDHALAFFAGSFREAQFGVYHREMARALDREAHV
jgi:hypothetical protein